MLEQNYLKAMSFLYLPCNKNKVKNMIMLSHLTVCF